MSIENKHAGLRITLAAAAALTVAGVAIGKTMRDELEKAKVAASEPVVPGKSTLENPTPEASPSATLQVRQMTATEIATTYPTATRMPETPTTAPTETVAPPPSATATEKPVLTATAPAVSPTTAPTIVPATSTPKPDATATAVPATKVPETPTAPATAAATAPAKVEAPRFKSWGVYEGIAKNGGGVVFVTLPNGDVIFSSMIQEPRCTISGNVSGYYEFVFDAKGKYQPDRDNFAFPAGSARTKVIRIDLKNGETAEGSILEKGYSATSPKGPFTCPANEVKFTAKLVGEGMDALIQARENTSVAGGFDRPTKSQVISWIEDAFGKLPD